MSNSGSIRQDQTSLVGHSTWAMGGNAIKPTVVWAVDQPELTLTPSGDTQDCTFSNPSAAFTGVVNVTATASGVTLTGTITIVAGTVTGQLNFDAATP